MSHKHSISAPLLALFLAMGASACQQEGPAEEAGRRIDKAAEQAGEKMEQARERLNEKAEQAGDYMDDAAITARIKADILNEALLKASQISVSTTNGIVKLSGSVDSQYAKDKSVEIARNVKGVSSVENELAVKPAH